jgi:hypothetical protein
MTYYLIERAAETADCTTKCLTEDEARALCEAEDIGAETFDWAIENEGRIDWWTQDHGTYFTLIPIV